MRKRDGAGDASFATRARFVESALAPRVIATVHPSSLLSAPDEATRRAETARFVADLKKVAGALTADS